MNREFLMLAHTFEDSKHRVAGWLMSEKLDGQRCFWDGGITRGWNTRDVPWANVDKTVKPISTGLWSRYGNVIAAPDWFLDELPSDVCLDGELYLGRGSFQELRSIISHHVPDDRWTNVEYIVFDTPPWPAVIMDGRINNPNFKLEVRASDIRSKVKFRDEGIFTYETGMGKLASLGVSYHTQERLPNTEAAARERIREKLEEVCDAGGEGLMLRNPCSIWTPKRSVQLLKVKKLLDAEGVVCDWTKGEGKHEGRMGSLIVEWNGSRFGLSGFTDAERALTHYQMPAMPDLIWPAMFPKGVKVSFRYRELTDLGLPKEARYWRKA